MVYSYKKDIFLRPELNSYNIAIFKEHRTNYAPFSFQKGLTFFLIFDIIISRYYDIKNGGGIVNKTKTPTYEKIMIPLRLPPEIYNRMMDEVQKKKKDERGYSVNQYLTDILTKDLEGK